MYFNQKCESPLLSISHTLLSAALYVAGVLTCFLLTFRLNLDPAWAETGNRYMLKLFRDHLFHQVDEHGLPWVDMAHIVQSLNKVKSRHK